MGVYLVPELVSLGYEVHVTSRRSHHDVGRSVHYIKGDAKDDAFLDELLEVGYSAIIDFMVYHTEEFENRMIRLLAKTDHYVFLSSYRVYGDAGGRPITEESPLLIDSVDDQNYLDTDEYALTKARQERLLAKSAYSNWTVIRPAITYSKSRFQLGTMEAEEFLYRALKGKTIIFPKEMLEKQTTMSWAGDVARMISRIVCNEKAYGQTYTASTAEHHTWKEVIGFYQAAMRLEVKYVPLDVYVGVYGRPYQVKYDRMFDRVIDNSKILEVTGLSQSDLLPLKDGLKIELADFSRNPTFKVVSEEKEKKVDSLTRPLVKKMYRAIKRVKPRTRIKQIRAYRESRSRYDGAIVTLCGYYNYGSMIQRYALQQFLLEHGKKFRLLDLEFMHKSGKKAGDRTLLKQFALDYFDQTPFKPQYAKFYKAYIVGSDQVWRPYFKDWSKYGIFFLNFVTSDKPKRIAYAASFGESTLTKAGVDGSKQKKIRPLLKKFNAISVREESGVGLVRWLGCKAEHVLDPTLLMPASFYSEIVDRSKYAKTETGELFYYILDETEKKKEVLDAVSKSKGITSVFGLTPNNGLPLRPLEEWLKGFRDSKFVVTDSFHGMVLSIINHTDFIVFGNRMRGIARIAELLGKLGLDDRIVYEEDDFDVSSYPPIDWKTVDDKLEPLRSRSQNWLLGALSE